jgi:rod shape-determining protein MreC
MLDSFCNLRTPVNLYLKNLRLEMFSLRRWWDKNAAKFILTSLAVGGGFLVWQNQAALLLETYQKISRPFQPDPYRFDAVVNARTQQLQNEIAELQAQNQKMKSLLQAPNELLGKSFTAPVIGRSPDNWWQQLLVGRGSRDGIEVGGIVLGEGGLVGRVTQVTDHTSQVLLATDPSSRIGVLTSRSRHMGYIQGNGDRSSTVLLQFFDKNPDVKVGDVVTTSNVSQLFPGGLTVGRVIEVNLKKAPSPEALVSLTAPVSALEWVIVYPMHKQTGAAPSLDINSPAPAEKP